MAVNIDAVIFSLTLEEKISLLSGSQFSSTVAIQAKGVPSIETADGPNGVRPIKPDGSVHSACFPAGCCMAATFDAEIGHRLGVALAEEARSHNAQCMLGPTVGIHRHPLGGRNFESFSEDPLVAGRVSASFIRGMQSRGVSATLKHLAANEQETDRMTVDARVSERALREIYMRPFEIAVKESAPWAIMTGYNMLNGVHCDSNKWLLQDILRDEWGWNGMVMSDWGGTNSVWEGIAAGLDIEMPGPPVKRKSAAVLEALQKGLITEEQVDERVRNVLEWAYKLEAFKRAAITEEMKHPATSLDTNRPEHRALIREAGAKGMVLLKNEGNILPLTREKVQGKKIALIGFAKDAFAHGGGSAAVNCYYKVTPWDAMHAALGDCVEFSFAKGALRERVLPCIDLDDPSTGTIVGLDGKPGFTRRYYEPFGSEPISVKHSYRQSSFTPFNNDESIWKVLEIVGDFTPAEGGEHYMACSSLGAARVWIDDDLVFEQLENCSDPMGFMFLAATEMEFRYKFLPGRSYRLRIVSYPPVNLSLSNLEGKTGVRFGFSLQSIHDADLRGEAAAVASKADIAIIFAGHDSQWETEGRDQDSFDLPRKQNDLISAVASVNPNTIVVNSTGVAVSMPWVDEVKGLVQAWFAGQECGNSVTDILTGVVNPEGNLPVTFPARIEDTPAHGNFPGTYVDGKLKVNYAEDVFVGYRHFDRAPGLKVNFPFGFGLSYTTFEFAKNLAVRRKTADTFEVDVTVRNAGNLKGGVLVQLYVGNRCVSPEHPVKTLAAFQKIRIEPGQSQVATLNVAARDFAHYDTAASAWVIEEGEYTFSIGRSVSDICCSTDVKIGAHRYSTAPKHKSSVAQVDEDTALIPYSNNKEKSEFYVAQTEVEEEPAPRSVSSRRLALLPLLLVIPLLFHLIQSGVAASRYSGLRGVDLDEVRNQLELGLLLNEDKDSELENDTAEADAQQHHADVLFEGNGNRRFGTASRRRG